MNESLSTTADGRTMLQMERRLSHPPLKVWRALTEPAELSQWFPMTVVEIDLRAGGALRLDLGSDPNAPGPSVDDLHITEVDPPRLFEFNWHGEVLRWELRPDEGGCRLVFTHTFDDHAGAASFASGWKTCIDAMKLLLDDKPIPDEQPSAELHDSYVDAFELDTGVSEDTGDGWRVRFERQLTAPAETAWAALTEGMPPVGDPPPQAFTVDSVSPGTVTAADAPTILEYEWLADGRHPAGRVRWEIRDEDGTGHGARLILTQSGGVETKDRQADALEAWRRPIRRLAELLRADQ
ncbi:SRPBCC family protein [Phytoactinopolyspora endophytica]|uniref:SRPBCC family protein n=1 Tax=Phytoactinopolyspora endophytica TaxID=1642495 RepID=UPI00101D2728|nr:SRPBCC family protein [Phytoactinopolyspora endophytica]